MVTQDKGYRHTQSLQYLANFPGARVEKDRLAVAIERADGPLDVSAATVPVEVINPGELTTEDTTRPYDIPSSDSVLGGSYAGPADYPGIGDAVHHVTLTAQRSEGVTRILGAVESTGSYDVHVLQGPPDASEPLLATQVASGVAGGQVTEIDVAARALACTVAVVDASGTPADQEVTGAIHVA